VIAAVAGKLASKAGDRVVVETPGGVAYEVVVPLGVMERLPGAGDQVTLATELVVREDGWALFGFLEGAERRFFQRLLGVSGVGPKLAIAVLSALGAGRAARAIKARDIATLSSVSGIGKKTAERLALELGDKVGEFVGAPEAESGAPIGGAGGGGGSAAGALQALERLGYTTAEAEKALRRALSGGGDGGDRGDRGDRGKPLDTEALVRRALQLLTES
jgi:holliday junction DNA helicase RuvA